VAILRQYRRRSTVDAACELYPSLKGKEWFFDRVPANFWADLANQRRFASWLKGKLGIVHWTDWYLVTDSALRSSELGASSILRIYRSSIYKMCVNLYPERKWDELRFKKLGKIQKLMGKILLTEMKGLEVKTNYLHPDLRFKDSGRKMELDFWFPTRNLAIEYQGEYHDTPRGGTRQASKLLGRRKQLDDEKRLACARLGIILIEIWHHQVSHERETIRNLLIEALGYYSAPVSLLRPLDNSLRVTK
jgi:hypothetical protein